ncbi:hypothetical protein GCM10011393_09820 [Sphingopyxis bauzanensis]|nr:hypothetical protein GCM10011393_09820 [Sphingopyxis bauzanensis]
MGKGWIKQAITRGQSWQSGNDARPGGRTKVSCYGRNSPPLISAKDSDDVSPSEFALGRTAIKLS